VRDIYVKYPRGGGNILPPLFRLNLKKGRLNLDIKGELNLDRGRLNIFRGRGFT